MFHPSEITIEHILIVIIADLHHAIADAVRAAKPLEVWPLGSASPAIPDSNSPSAQSLCIGVSTGRRASVQPEFFRHALAAQRLDGRQHFLGVFLRNKEKSLSSGASNTGSWPHSQMRVRDDETVFACRKISSIASREPAGINQVAQEIPGPPTATGPRHNKHDRRSGRTAFIN